MTDYMEDIEELLGDSAVVYHNDLGVNVIEIRQAEGYTSDKESQQYRLMEAGAELLEHDPTLLLTGVDTETVHLAREAGEDIRSYVEDKYLPKSGDGSDTGFMDSIRTTLRHPFKSRLGVPESDNDAYVALQPLYNPTASDKTSLENGEYNEKLVGYSLDLINN